MDDSSPEIKRLVRERFAAAVDYYVTDRVLAEGDELSRMVELAHLTGDERVLDVATGAGHTALAFAPHVVEVVALDLTREMLDAAARHVAAQGVANVSFHLGDAEAMPFADAEFDVVTARFAPHHFPAPDRFVAEAARVLRPGGRLVLYDNMAPEDDELDMFLDRLERWRDPSHYRSYRASEWVAMLEAAGLRVEAVGPLERKRYEFRQWATKQHMPPAERDALGRWLLAAPARCRDYFNVTAENGEVSYLDATFSCIAGIQTASSSADTRR